MIYPYKCTDCSELFSFYMPINTYLLKKEKVVCPYCFSIKTQRVFEPTPVIFKGEGFTKSAKDGGNEYG